MTPEVDAKISKCQGITAWAAYQPLQDTPGLDDYMIFVQRATQWPSTPSFATDLSTPSGYSINERHSPSSGKYRSDGVVSHARRRAI